MRIKQIDDKTRHLKEIESLLPYASHEQREKMQRDLWALRKGFQNEKQAAYLIDAAFGKRQNTLILHDLRLCFDNEVAQIDHLLINAGAIYLLESKYFSDRVEIDCHGNWTAHYPTKSIGIPSPLEQNRRHKALLSRILDQNDLIPRRLGIKVDLPIYDYVLLSTNCRIDGEVPPNVIKVDKVETKIEQDQETELDRFFGLNSFKILVNLITRNEMRTIADALLAFHQPLEIDYAKKYGINAKQPIDQTLYKHLHRLRETLARKTHIAPETLLPDTTLEAFARHKPQNPEETKRLTGMDEALFRRVGYKFLNAVLEFQSSNEHEARSCTV